MLYGFYFIQLLISGAALKSRFVVFLFLLLFEFFNKYICSSQLAAAITLCPLSNIYFMEIIVILHKSKSNGLVKISLEHNKNFNQSFSCFCPLLEYAIPPPAPV